MTLLWLDGFDHYTTTTQLASKGYSDSWCNPGKGGRFGEGYSLGGGQSWWYAQKNVGAAYTTLYTGLAVRKRISLAPIVYITRPVFYFIDELGSAQVEILVDTNYAVKAYRSGTLLGTSANNVIPPAGWFYIEAMVTISATVGAVTVRINGVDVLTLTNENTKAGTAYIQNIRIAPVYPDSVDGYIDDFYIDSAQFHGNVHVKTFMPDADGVHSDFTRNTGANDYECVDEITPNDDTDYVESSTVGNKSTFGITTGALETVKAMQFSNRLVLPVAGTRTVKPLLRSNSVDYLGGLFNPISDTYLFYSRLYETDPDDSNPWTQAKLEAAEFGLEIIS